MVDVKSKIIIARPIEAVSQFASNPDNTRKWYKNIKSVERKTSNGLELGAQIAFKAQFLGRELAYVYEVTEMNLPFRFVMRTTDGPFPMETTYEWKKIDKENTEMSLRNAGSPKGFKSVFAPFMSMAMRRANQKDLELLKAILEK